MSFSLLLKVFYLKLRIYLAFLFSSEWLIAGQLFSWRLYISCNSFCSRLSFQECLCSRTPLEDRDSDPPRGQMVFFSPWRIYFFSPNFGNRLFFFFFLRKSQLQHIFSQPQNLNIKFIIILRVMDKIKLKIKSFTLKENLFAFLMARLKVLGYLCKGITCTLMNICSRVLVLINLFFSVF